MYKVLRYLDPTWEVTDEYEDNMCLSSYELLDLIKDGRTSNCACVELNKSKYIILEDTASKVRVYRFNGAEIIEIDAEIKNRLESSLDAFDFLTKRHNVLAEAYDILRSELEEEKRDNKALKKKVKKLKKNKKKKMGVEIEQLKADYQNIKAELEAKAEEVKLLEKKLTEAELRISLDEQLMAENNIDSSLDSEQTVETQEEQAVETQTEQEEQEEQEEHDTFFSDLGPDPDLLGEQEEHDNFFSDLGLGLDSLGEQEEDWSCIK